MGGKLPDGVKAAAEGCQLLRVNAHGGIHKGQLLRQSQGGPAALLVAARVDDQVHPLGMQLPQQPDPVGVKGLVVVMGMCVKIHDLNPFFVA